MRVYIISFPIRIMLKNKKRGPEAPFLLFNYIQLLFYFTIYMSKIEFICMMSNISSQFQAGDIVCLYVIASQNS